MGIKKTPILFWGGGIETREEALGERRGKRKGGKNWKSFLNFLKGKRRGKK